MKAVICEKYGSLEHLSIKEIELPRVGRDELLIRIKTSTVASGDCVVQGANNPMIRLVFGFRRPRNPILGTDLAGVVVAVGEDVKSFQKDDWVIASTGMAFGCHAEYIVLKETQGIAKLPKESSFVDGVSLSLWGTVGLHYLRKMKHKKGGELLIYGGSGAVGVATLQLANTFGFKVSAVSSEKNHSLLKKLGAVAVYDYKSPGWKKDLGTYDVIFDGVGKTKKKEWDEYLKKDGAFYTISKGLVKECSDDLAYLVELYQKGSFVPIVDCIYPLKEIKEAYAYVQTGRKVGTVVIDIDL